MCGIAGSIGHVVPSPSRRTAALAAMGRRGPDAHGDFTGTFAGQRVSLLHTRLSIIDLDARANQPFIRDGLTLVFNGEIYNYVELRDELRAQGHTFTTHSDTEVVLAAYRVWGEACFDRFEGMWAIALLDPAHGLVLSRDRFGEKPLFTQTVDGTLYFASEISALCALSGRKPTVDGEHVARFLVNGYKAAHKTPRTFFKDVAVFPHASTALLHDGNPPHPTPYWRLRYVPNEAMTLSEALDGARERLDRAVQIRLRADVPLAFCLSGGVDSAALASIAAKRLGQVPHCFSIIDADARYDESENIDAVVRDLGCETFKIHTSQEGFFERLSDLVAYRRQPVFTISYYVHSFLSQSIHEQGYKIALSGTAADELFTGYYDHYSMWLAEMKATEGTDFNALVNDWKQSYGKVVRNPYLQDPLAFAKNPAQREHIFLNQDVFENLLCKPFHEDFHESRYTDNLLRNRMMNELFHESIPVILSEDDANSMRWSVENRSPYLDRALAEFLYTVPARHLIRDGYVKWLLRAATEGALTDSVRLDRTKKGFNASILSLLDLKDPATRERLLEPSPIFDIVDRDKFSKLLDTKDWPNSLSKFLFSFVSCKTFLDQHAAWRP